MDRFNTIEGPLRGHLYGRPLEYPAGVLPLLPANGDAEQRLKRISAPLR